MTAPQEPDRCRYRVRSATGKTIACPWYGDRSDGVPVESAGGAVLAYLCPICRSLIGDKPRKRQATK